MDALRQFKWVFNPRNALWLCGYLLLVELKPCVQQKIEHLLELAPTDLVLGVFVLIGLYLVFMPEKSREQLKDLWQGGHPRLQARLAIKKLREEIEKYSTQRVSQTHAVLLSASVTACTAVVLFQSGSYDEAAQMASSALQILESSLMDA